MSVPLHAPVYDDGHTRLMVNITGDTDGSGVITAGNFGLTLYAVRVVGGPPFTLKLSLADAARLHAQLDAVSLIRDASQPVSGRFVEVDPERVTPEMLAAIGSRPDFFQALLNANIDAVRSFVEMELDDADCVGIAYRKNQLALMERMLVDRAFFDSEKAAQKLIRDEQVWQVFFERNHWIFGYGLSYVVGDAFSPERLEQVTSGFSIEGPGKRSDALLRTRGRIQALCFVEIKTPETPLLGAEYRSGCWQPSEQLGGTVAQSQGTVHRAVETIGTRLRELDGGFAVGDIYNVLPRSFAVVGSLSQFQNAAGQVHERKFCSFELYRRQLLAPAVITFDELLERARTIVDRPVAASP